MIKSSYPLYLGSEPVATGKQLEVTDKYRGRVITRVALAGESEIEKAIGLAVGAEKACRELAGFERAQILEQCGVEIKKREPELAELLCLEVGKPLRDAKAEVTRLLDTFRMAQEEATRLGGEYLPLDISARTKNYRGQWKRVPVGACSLISPFNFPLNLSAHKIAPAIAVGCPFVLKPASRTPVSALILGEILAGTRWPKGAFSILPCPREHADKLCTDERLKLLSFTGSPAAGWELKKKAGKKKIVLELGGNAAAIVEPDANLDDAVERLVIGTFAQSGQSCISVQRILVQESIYDTLKEKLLHKVNEVVVGDPANEKTQVGPLIEEKEAVRLEKWMAEAVAAGAKVLCGGRREGAVFWPTLLEKVPAQHPLCAQEAFGPLAVLVPYKTFDDALRLTNDSRYGLQAGVFTRDIGKIHRAWDELEVGGVIINDVPSWRVDHMPYGGVKDSGFGREGIRFAMEDMTEIRLLVVRT